MQLNRLEGRNNCIMAGRTKILIANSINKAIIDTFSPDIVILTGSRPEVDFVPDVGLQYVMTLIASEGSPNFMTLARRRSATIYPVYLVKKSGAFIRRI